MQQYMRKFLETPRRVSPARAKWIAVLSLIMFGFAAAALASYSGLSRTLHVTAFSLIGLSNLALAIGSLLPEDEGGKTVRDAMRPLVIVMLIALLATLALEVTGNA
jgi:hypothetical protein